MKFLLLTVLCFAAVFAAPSQKQKRDILPGDPRYGTDYHHQHHHAHHGSNVEVSQANGGYVGSYNSPSASYPVPHTSYGPPNYKPGKPITTDYLPPNNGVQVNHQASAAVPHPHVHVPAPSYGQPAVQVNHQASAAVSHPQVHVPASSYGPPAVQVNHQPSAAVSHPQVHVPASSYGPPAVQVNHQASAAVSHPHVHVPAPSYGAPVQVNHHASAAVSQPQVHVPAPSYGAPTKVNQYEPVSSPVNSYKSQLTSYDVPIASVNNVVQTKNVNTEYGAPVVDSSVKSVNSQLSSYGTPAVLEVQQQVNEASQVETSHVHTAVKSVQPVVQHQHVENIQAVQQPQVKVAHHQHVQQSNGGFDQSNQGAFSSGYDYSHVGVAPIPSYPIPQVHHTVQHYVHTPVTHQQIGVEKQIQIPEFIQNVFPNFQVPSFVQDTLSNFQLPQFPSLPDFGSSSSSSVVAEIPSSVPTKSQSIQSSSSQQYDSNGGYVY